MKLLTIARKTLAVFAIVIAAVTVTFATNPTAAESSVATQYTRVAPPK